MAISASPITIVCVADYEASRRLLETEAAATALAGRLLIQLTTGTPQDARDGENWSLQHGVRYLDGAIMATPKQVGKAETSIFVSGSSATFAEAEPLLRILAGNLQHMGEPIGAAAAWDLATLSHLFGGVLGFYHGARIMESEGIRVDAFGSLMAALAPVMGEIVQHDSDTIQAENYDDPESSVETCWKAMELLSKHAQESQINADFPRFASMLFQKGMDAGYGNRQSSALMKVLRESA